MQYLLQVDTFTQFEGDKERLGDAEKFFMELIKLSEYELRIEAIILKGEFNSLIGSIRPNIQILNQVCRKLYDNHSIKSFFRYILHAGNFINKVSFPNDQLNCYFRNKMNSFISIFMRFRSYTSLALKCLGFIMTVNPESALDART